MTLLAGRRATTNDVNPPAGKLSLGASQTIVTATTTKLTLDTVEHNFRSVTDAANNRLVVPSGADGPYLLNLVLRWSADTTGGRVAIIAVNGTTVAQQSGAGTSTARGGTANCVTVVEELAAGDFVEAFCYQNSGADQDASTNFGGTHLSATFMRFSS